MKDSKQFMGCPSYNYEHKLTQSREGYMSTQDSGDEEIERLISSAQDKQEQKSGRFFSEGKQASDNYEGKLTQSGEGYIPTQDSGDEEIERLIFSAQDKQLSKKRRPGLGSCVYERVPEKKLKTISGKLSVSREIARPDPIKSLQIPNLHNFVERLSISNTDTHNQGVV